MLVSVSICHINIKEDKMIKVTAYTLIIIILLNIIGCTSVYTITDIHDLYEDEVILSVKVKEEGKITPGAKVESVLLKDQTEIKFDEGRFFPKKLYNDLNFKFSKNTNNILRQYLNDWESNYYPTSPYNRSNLGYDKNKYFNEFIKLKEIDWAEDIILTGYDEKTFYLQNIDDLTSVNLIYEHGGSDRIEYTDLISSRFTNTNYHYLGISYSKFIPKNFIDNIDSAEIEELTLAQLLYLVDWDQSKINYKYFLKSSKDDFNNYQYENKVQFKNEIERIKLKYMYKWNFEFDNENPSNYYLTYNDKDKVVKNLSLDDIYSVNVRRVSFAKTSMLIFGILIIPAIITVSVVSNNFHVPISIFK